MNKSDKYLKIVEWSDEDNCYIGSVPGFLGPCCHGDNELDVYKQLCQILDEWLEIHDKEQIPLPEATLNKIFSGKFVLRIDKDLHKLLAIRALQSNLSLNQLCENILKDSILDKKPA
ncbi:MAG: toxin-antitoxin system HicB family antitoxin [Candidatus Riflebacteria bacterium]|nr:toxin-antitoxin system HicB family antitoxin [Candidatus Riflebacteria bacterium]